MHRRSLAALPFLAAPAAAQPAPSLFPLVADVLTPPWIFPGADGLLHMVYEIRLANVLPGPLRLQQLVVQEVATRRALKALAAPELTGRLQIGMQRQALSNTLGNAQFGILFMHVALAAELPPPAALRHEFTLFAEPLGMVMSLSIAPTAVRADPPPVLGPPLRGGRYVVGDGCCDSTRHVRALLPLDGSFRLAQRFAVDWERLDEDGRIYVGEKTDPRSYHIYGQPVLAVADGTVVAALDGLADHVPGTYPSNLPLGEADGNHVILDTGGGAFVLCAHMRPGSVAVRRGDRVRRGQVLGEVGNTGNSVAPHLHLHVMDGPATLSSNGIPSVFESFTVTGFNPAGTADFDRAEGTGVPMTVTQFTPPRQARGAMPMDLTIIDWPGG